MSNTTASIPDRRQHQKRHSNPNTESSSQRRDNAPIKPNYGSGSSNLDRTPESGSSPSKSPKNTLDLNLVNSPSRPQNRRSHTPKAAQSLPSTPSSQGSFSQSSTPKSPRRRKSSNPPLSNASSVEEGKELLAAKFITVTQAIDPVRLIPSTSDPTLTTIVHGANLYLEWIERSLRTYEEVTLVGVDQGITSTVSLVLMLDDAGIAFHHAAETFTMREAGVFKSCILFRLHSRLK